MPKIVKVERKNGKVIAKNKSDGNSRLNLNLDGLQNWYRTKTDQYGTIPIMLSALGSMILFALFFGLFAYFYYEKDFTKMLGFFGWVITLDILAMTIWLPLLAYIVAFYMLFQGNDILITFFGLEHTALTNCLFIIWFICLLLAHTIVLMVLVVERRNQIDRHRQKMLNLEQLFRESQAKSQGSDKESQKGSTSLMWIIMLVGLLILGSFLIGMPIYSYIENHAFTTEEIYMIIGGSFVVVGGLIALWLMRRSK